MRRSLFTISAFLLLVAAPAHAQFTNAPAPIEYNVTPEVPGPNEKVVVSMRSIGSFLGNATVTWQENGKVVSTGVGLTSYTTKVGSVGTQTHLVVTVRSTDTGTFTQDFYFAPSLVYLTWEADTSVPLFYQGKPLYSAGSDLRVIALPIVVSGKSLIPANKLSYQWTRNNNLVPEASGEGRSVFEFSGDQLQPAEYVSLDVLYGSTRVAHNELVVPVATPKVLLYSRDPLRGEILERALPKSTTLTANELTLQAEPYYFSNASIRRGTVSFGWTINGNDTSGPQSAKGLLTLRQSGQGAGAAVVGVAVQNSDNDGLLQAAQQTLTLTFGQSTSAVSSFLGL